MATGSSRQSKNKCGLKTKSKTNSCKYPPDQMKNIHTLTHTHTHTDKTGLKMSSARNRQVGHNLKGVQTAVKTEQPQV